MRIVLSIAALVALSACSDPLDRVGKLSDVELSENNPVRGAVAAPAELAHADAGVFDRLFQRARPQQPVSSSSGVPMLSPSLTVVPSAVKSDGVSVRQTAKHRRALLASFRRAAAVSVAAMSQQSRDLAEKSANAASQGVGTDQENSDFPKVAVAAKRGFLSGLLAQSKVDAVIPQGTTAEPQLASLERKAPATDRNGPLIARKRNGPDALDVPYGTQLPFGAVARVCDAKTQSKGKRIEKAGTGRGYAIYDSNPGSVSPRTFYVTGFSDGCPRQFTAALAMFGEPQLHEQLRYGRPSDQYPYSTTDKAYEKVKSTVCNVARGKPCGTKIKRLEGNTVFISTYERFTDNGRWADMLLHKGSVLASALKDL